MRNPELSDFPTPLGHFDSRHELTTPQHSDEKDNWGEYEEQDALWDPQDSLHQYVSDPPAGDLAGISSSSESFHAAAERKQATDRWEWRNRCLGSGRFLAAENTAPLRAPGVAAPYKLSFSVRLEQKQKPIEVVPFLLGRNYLVVFAIIIVKPHYLLDELDCAVLGIVGYGI
ncbi:MAG: hypothetical protein ABSG32_12980 [Terriglobia bacterium]